MLARAGAPVVMVCRKSFVDAFTANGLVIERAADQERVSVEATTELSAVAGADLILFCVKSNDTVSAAKKIAPFLAADALLVSLQNGVDNVERIRDATKIDALPAAAYIEVWGAQPGQTQAAERCDEIHDP